MFFFLPRLKEPAPNSQWKYFPNGKDNMAKRQLPPTITVREVQTTARPRTTAGTITITLGSDKPDASPEYERLVKRARSGMDEEGPSGDRKVLPQHPLEYKKDEEESEGETDLPDPQEERMAQWLSEYTCEHCGRVETYAHITADYPYCSSFCSNRSWDAICQDRDDQWDWFTRANPNSPLLQDYFLNG